MQTLSLGGSYDSTGACPSSLRDWTVIVRFSVAYRSHSSEGSRRYQIKLPIQVHQNIRTKSTSLPSCMEKLHWLPVGCTHRLQDPGPSIQGFARCRPWLSDGGLTSEPSRPSRQLRVVVAALAERAQNQDCHVRRQGISKVAPRLRNGLHPCHWEALAEQHHRNPQLISPSQNLDSFKMMLEIFLFTLSIYSDIWVTVTWQSFSDSIAVRLLDFSSLFSVN